MNRSTDPSIDGLTGRAIEGAQGLIRRSRDLRTRGDRANERRFERLFRDPEALEVTITLTDDVMRFASSRAAATQLRRAARRASATGFGVVNALGLRTLARLSGVLPGAAVAIVHARVRALTQKLIGDDDSRALSAKVAQRRASGQALNVNVLGEAVLGEREARDRLSRVLEMIAREDVDYVSVKLSALVSQIVTFDHDGSRHRVAASLRTLYRVAQTSGTFVNLDMEEYRDLRMTVDAFTLVLDESEFTQLTAGIVLQAYLPESHDVLAYLTSWARERVAKGGAPIKIRLVKGANLAMERAESQLHNWTAAPYATKADVDASYLRLLDVALSKDLVGVLRVGVASHNLFHVAWALEVARERGVEDQLDVEMLEGMAPAEAAALAASGQRVLLYAPVTRRDDFAAAVAYLVRRLDENTSPENYLRAAFSFEENPAALGEQRERFAAALASRHEVSTLRRRHGVPVGDVFANEPDGDPTDPDYVAAVEDARKVIFDVREVTIGDVEIGDVETGIDPSDGGRAWYRYRVADVDVVDEALRRARAASESWGARTGASRAQVLREVARVMAASRARSIAVMARDTGKTVAEADPEVSEAIDFVRYYADFAEASSESAPLGVVLVVPPWNFPFSIPTGGIAGALAAGNAVILKPAPEAVAVAGEIAEQFWAGGVSRDVLQFVPTRDDEVGRRLVTHDDVDAVILTGSIDTARLFLTWKPSLRLLAETSGKNAILVTACADVDQAVRDVVASAFSHAGQKCSASSLVIVERSLWEDSTFVAQLTDAVTSLAIGSARDSSTVVGPLIRPPGEALRRALGCEPGERWLVEPRQLDAQGFSWSPGVKVGIAPGSWSHLNEWFGPVLGVMIAPDFATALRWQNGVPFGLTAGIASLDEDECAAWIDAVEAGNLYVNRGVTGAVVRRQPFGGWKMSSVGPTAKAGGRHYVDALRDFPRVSDAISALESAARWYRDEGGAAHDDSGLEVERNVVRFRRRGPIIVRVDADLSTIERDYLSGLVELLGINVSLSCAVAIDGLGPIVEDVATLSRRARGAARVRWLSVEAPPVPELLDAGVTVDPRPLAQAGAIEAPRWLFEQSVSITRHRYGNVHAGPQPDCEGLSNSGTTP